MWYWSPGVSAVFGEPVGDTLYLFGRGFPLLGLVEFQAIGVVSAVVAVAAVVVGAAAVGAGFGFAAVWYIGFLSLGDVFEGGYRVVQHRGADLESGGPGRPVFGDVGGVADTAARDDR